MDGDSVIGDTHDIIMTFTPDVMESVRSFTCTCIHIKCLCICSFQFQLLWGTFVILRDKMKIYVHDKKFFENMHLTYRYITVCQDALFGSYMYQFIYYIQGNIRLRPPPPPFRPRCKWANLIKTGRILNIHC